MIKEMADCQTLKNDGYGVWNTHIFHFSGANIAIRLKFHNKVVQVLCRTSHYKYIKNRKNMAYLVKKINNTI